MIGVSKVNFLFVLLQCFIVLVVDSVLFSVFLLLLLLAVFLLYLS